MTTDRELPNDEPHPTRRRWWPAFVLVVIALCAVGWLLPRPGSKPWSDGFSCGNLGRIARAIHCYALVNDGWLPPAVVTDRAGQPLCSWRVLILPYLGEEDLYNEFHLYEPWDSPHNRALLPRMPWRYAIHDDPAAAEFRTCYRVFAGEAAAFPASGHWQEGALPRGRRFPQDFPDGTTNTLLVVEAAEAVPWTKPDELIYDPNKPLPELGGWSKEPVFREFKEVGRSPYFSAVFADCSVSSYPTSIPEVTLRALITRNGRERVDRSKVMP